MTGKTTQQMLDAPTDSYYIWPVSQTMPYAIRLARDLGRTDLKIRPLSSLPSIRYRGKRLSGVVVDHACWPTQEQQEIISHMKKRVF